MAPARKAVEQGDRGEKNIFWKSGESGSSLIWSSEFKEGNHHAILWGLSFKEQTGEHSKMHGLWEGLLLVLQRSKRLWKDRMPRMWRAQHRGLP